MKKLRMTVDLVMVLLLPMLMGYSLVGELYHEIIGVLMAILFTVHIALNRKWFTTIFKGRYNARRAVTTVVNLLLILCVLTSMVSGIFISKHIFTFLGISVGASVMRTLHMLAAYWGFLLMSFHAGTHGSRMIGNIKNKAVKYSVSTTSILIASYGVCAFIKRSFADYLFGRITFVFLDFSEPFVFFYLDYLAVMILLMVLGCLMVKLLKKTGGQHGIRKS